MKGIISVFVIIIIILVSCGKRSVNYNADCSTTKSYATDVSLIIQSSCATNSGCHASGSSNGPGALTTYTQVYTARAAIHTAVANGSMPQNGSLTNDQKNAIICWIDNGAANN